MNSRKLILSFLLAWSFLLGACGQKHQLISGTPQMGPMVGVATAPSTPAVPKVEKVRLRDENGKKVFEYLDPTATPDKWVAYGTVEIHKAGTQFYHWGPKDDVEHWATEGISDEDIDSAVRGYDTSDVLGGGFYASLSPTDSASYGVKQLVIEPKHDVVSLFVTGWTYDPELRSIFYSSGNVYIPVPLIAEAGIETLRYTDAWMVCILGKPLENLFEGSWKNLLTHGKNEGPSILDAFTFAEKYELTPEVADLPEFQKKFPVLVKYVKKEQMSETELAEFAKFFLANTSSFGFGTTFKVWDDLMAQLKPHLAKLLAEELQSYIKLSNYDMIEYSTLAKLKSLGMTIVDVMPTMRVFVNEKIEPPVGTLPQGISLKYSQEMSTLAQNLAYVNIYELLSKLSKGENSIEVLCGSLKGEPTPSAKVSLKTISYQSSKAFDELSTVWEQSTAVWRDKSLLATGEYALDGPNQPGYLKVTAAELKELEANPWIRTTVKEKIKADGSREIYVRYEYPNARNYKNFATELKNAELLLKLQEADKKGELASDSSPVHQQLTQEVLKAIADQVLSQSRMTFTLSFAQLQRIHPLADPVLNQKVLQALLYRLSNQFIVSVDPDWLKVATPLEMLQMKNTSATMGMSIYKTLNFNWITIQGHNTGPEYDQDLGLWEIAANLGGEHKDPAAFVKALRTRFEAADVQQWLQEKSYGKIQRALNEAGKGL